MLTLRQLRQFLVVAETMNIRKAAERLHIAQPPLTKAIRQMEEALGTRLFERTNRITALTPAGNVLQKEAVTTLMQMERSMLLTRRAGQGMTGALRIGFVATAVRHLLPEMIARFHFSFPQVVLELNEMTTARQVASLLDDSLDVGIAVLPVPEYAIQKLSYHRFFNCPLIAVLPNKHPAAASGALSLSALAEEPWILFPEQEGPGLYRSIIEACEKEGFMPEVVQRAVQMETIVGLVASGLGVSLVPEFMQKSGWVNVSFCPLSGEQIPYQVALIHKPENTNPYVADFVRNAVPLQPYVPT
ncbi:LysR family transcriptional regulator [Serratia marcescens]|uniref:LysR family transcriptional regulator n=1 Tax=Serratia marcescens TaxID=615 RepID=UPI001068B695|nr:LysR family transcriptional regulator [Serratia marcescens]TEW81054.1 LysR family transcriptional regulator [Serratia marcescens]